MSLPGSEEYFSNSRYVKELKESNFRDVFLPSVSDPCVILFYAHWCGHCKSMRKVWEDFGKVAPIKVYALNHAKLRSNSKLMNGIRGYPTIIFYNKGRPVKMYNGKRTVNDLLAACRIAF